MKFILSKVCFKDVIERHCALPKKKRVRKTKTLPKDDTLTTTDILHERSKKVSYFLDVNRIKHKLWVNMINFSADGLAMVMPMSTDKPCWWCRHKFITHPIGVPLRYHAQLK